VVARSRLGQSDVSAGLQAHRSGGDETMPRGSADVALRRVVGRLPTRVADNKSKALLSAPRGISATCPASKCRRTAGCERGCMPTQVATRLHDRKDQSAASTVGADAERPAPTILRVQTVRLRGGATTAEQSSFSQLKLSENRRKQFISNDGTSCMQRRRQRFPTVRTVCRIGNGEV
jgi:hypothetical protein